MSFNGTGGSGFSIPLGTSSQGGGDEDGLRPMELLLIGLAGCTGMDVVSILQKMRQELTGFEVRVQADRAEEHPKVFTHIVLEYIVEGRGIDPESVQRAVELSEVKYCSAEAMLNKTAKIESKIIILEAEAQ